MSLYIATTVLRVFAADFTSEVILRPGDLLIHIGTVDLGSKKGRLERFILPNGRVWERGYAWNCPLGRRQIIPFDRGAPAVARMPEWTRWQK